MFGDDFKKTMHLKSDFKPPACKSPYFNNYWQLLHAI